MLTELERFERFYIPEPNTGCWLWLGQISTEGYGRFCASHQDRVYAHHYSYRTFVGPLVKGLEVCHECDVKSCVNPEHLILGTRQKNARDAVNRGLYHAGTRHRLARLTPDQIVEIRNAPGIQREIAERFGISQAMVSLIKLRKNWRTVQ